jgi:hypothetical protein
MKKFLFGNVTNSELINQILTIKKGIVYEVYSWFSFDNEFTRALETGNKYFLSDVLAVEYNYDCQMLIYVVDDPANVDRIQKLYLEVLAGREDLTRRRVECIYARRFQERDEIYEFLTRLQYANFPVVNDFEPFMFDNNVAVKLYYRQ